MAPAFWQLAFVVFPAIAILHLHVSPYTKVEESFNIQAIHDILEYGVPISDAFSKFMEYFDHMTFPGAVPRTFVGSLLLSGLAKPEIWLGDLVGMAAQTHVRAVLGGMNATALAIFARSVERAYGPIAATWYVVLQASQFHVWYYASRTLPNMFAFFMSTISLALLLPSPTSTWGPKKRARLALYFMTIATVIFRSELALLLGSHCIYLLLKPQTLDAKIALFRTIFLPSMIPGALIALLITISVDTHFWQSASLLWPELSAFLANIFPTQGSKGASEWGTQPFYWYLLHALPRLLMTQLPMVDLFFLSPSTYQDIRVLDNLIPSYAYLVLYSILPHKETRFMFPIVPSLTLVAALTCTRLTINAHKSVVTKALLYAAILSTILTAFISHAILLPLSAQNYPGGHALETLHSYYHDNYGELISASTGQPEIHVHLTNLALQSGVTRFLEQPLHIEDTDTDGRTQSDVSLTVQQQSNTQGRKLNAITLSGDANHPALTIQPQTPPQSSTTPLSTNKQRHPQSPHWIYDKTSNATRLLEPLFWTPFTFAIVEDPALAIGAWRIISEVQALGPPHITHSNEQANPRYKQGNTWHTPDELFSYWTSLQPHDTDNTVHNERTTALLHAMYPSYVSVPLSRMLDIVHDVLRLGRFTPFSGLTRGYWVEIPLVTRLYVLQRAESGIGGGGGGSHPGPPHAASRAGTTRGQSVPVPNRMEAVVEGSGAPPLGLAGGASVEREVLGSEALGPLVVNKDGTLSRLDNWAQMTEQEKRRTVEYLGKRNMIRLEDVEAATQ